MVTVHRGEGLNTDRKTRSQCVARRDSRQRPGTYRVDEMSDETRQTAAAETGRTPILVRRGEPADAPAIAKLIVWENSRPADAAAIERYLMSAPSVIALVDGELVGMIYLSGEPLPVTPVRGEDLLSGIANAGSVGTSE